MKVYKEYMDNITVSDAMHRNFTECAARSASARQPFIIRRCAAAFVCLALIITGFLALPRLTRNNVVPEPDDTPSASLTGSVAVSPEPDAGFSLVFNKAVRQRADKTFIPGHFWHELSSDELEKVFAGLTDTYAITATANFNSDENGASLLNVKARATSAAGHKAYIQIAPGKAILDYVLDGETKTSDVYGTSVTAGYYITDPNSKGQSNVFYFASFSLSGLGYYAELSGIATESETLRDGLSELVGLLIKNGAADLGIFEKPEIPELRNDKLDLKEAYADPDFGAYLPKDIPSGFALESATRFINQESDYLSALWIRGMREISWNVSFIKEKDKTRITPASDTKNYDLELYPVPRADSVPDELRNIVANPIFRSDELTLDVVRARAYEASDAGDISGPRMRFGVLCGDILVQINVKGAEPEWVFETLKQLAE